MNYPNIPDNYYKLLILAGALIVGYAYFEVRQQVKDIAAKRISYREYVDSLQIKKMELSHQADKLLGEADRFAAEFGIENPVVKKDTVISFNDSIVRNSKTVMITDTAIQRFYDFKDRIADYEFKAKIMLAKISMRGDIVKEDYSDSRLFEKLSYVGMFFLALGFFGFARQQNLQDKLLSRQLVEKPMYYKSCQSCGKNFSAIRKYGKEADGAVNAAFCQKCYDNGQFTEPELTLEMLKIKMSVEQRNRGRFNIWMIKRKLSGLERWRREDYF